MLVFSTDTEENKNHKTKESRCLNPDEIQISTLESPNYRSFYLNSDIGNKFRCIIGRETHLKASSSTTVFPTQVAPPSTRDETTGLVEEAASCVLTQSG